MSMQKQMDKVRTLPIDPKEEWVMERRTIDISVEELGESAHPDMLVCVSLKTGLIVGTTVVSPDAPESEALSWALDCMLSPMMGRPHRPGTVTLAGGRLKHLKEVLEQLDIEVSAISLPSPVIDEVVAALVEDMNKPGLPPYTLEEDVDPETVAEFFRAAAEYYKLKPWKLFEYELPIKIELQLEKKVDYWAIVIGTGEQEFGLNLYRSFDALIDLMEAEDDAETLELSQKTWSLGFSYDDIDEIGPAAEAEYLTNGWVLAGKSAYPSAIVIDPKIKDFVRRPTDKELVELTAATRALTDFLRAHRKQLKTEEEPVITETRQIEVAGGKTDVFISLPAPELVEEEEELIPVFDRPSRIASTPLERAQDLVYEAWEEESKNKRIKLARQAIIISPDCADAYYMLAQDAARDSKEAEKLLQQAVEAGERAIGEEFKELEGHFWLAVETRPYMRALMGLAQLRMDQGDLGQAIDDLKDMLRLNPGDNQGARYLLFKCLLLAGRDDELRQLMKQYEEEMTAIWQFTNALLSFRKSGESKKTNIDLAKAVARNIYVIDYLLERKRMPEYLPDTYTLGSKDEAVLYADLYMDAWKSTEGAIKWLRRNSPKASEQENKKRSK